MNLNEFNRELAKKRRELDNLMRRKLPIKVGNMAKAHYQDNIRDESFTNFGKQPWPKTKRQQSGGKSAAANYGALQSSRNHLYSSIKYTPSDYRVRVANDLIYAPVHNWGGTVSPTVTSKMKKFAWAMYYRETGVKMSKKVKESRKAAAENGKSFRAKRTKKQKEKFDNASEDANNWKGLALKKVGTKLNIKIPQRQFLGESKELNEQIQKTISDEIRNVLNS
jgi:phage gpG-like protein